MRAGSLDYPAAGIGSGCKVQHTNLLSRVGRSCFQSTFPGYRIGDDPKLYEMYCTNRQAFAEIALEIGAKRRAFFNRALECAALGLPPDVPFPG